VPADEIHACPHDPVRAGLRLACSRQCGVPPVSHAESSPRVTSGRGIRRAKARPPCWLASFCRIRR
jgi:hypothetical protein